jgi:hypothetical protein
MERRLSLGGLLDKYRIKDNEVVRESPTTKRRSGGVIFEHMGSKTPTSGNSSPRNTSVPSSPRTMGSLSTAIQNFDKANPDLEQDETLVAVKNSPRRNNMIHQLSKPDVPNPTDNLQGITVRRRSNPSIVLSDDEEWKKLQLKGHLRGDK